MVKKEYVKPEMVVEQFMAELAFLVGSNIGGDNNENDNQDDFSTNERRGGWGSLWD